MKDFREEFFKFVEKIKKREPFAFSRFSDGELRVLQNKELILGDTNIQIGDTQSNHHWTRPIYDQKHFNPTEHKWVRDKLIECLSYKQKNYYIGICCKCCLSGQQGYTTLQEFNQQLEWADSDENDEYLTWSNLFLNGNYPVYLEHFVPYYFNYDVYLVVNEHAKLDRLPFPIVKDFRVGNNCMVNDIDLIDKLKEEIKTNNIKNSLFLISAATLTNFIIRDLFEFENSNTYIDIGTTLQPFLQLPSDRRYIAGYWGGDPNGRQDLIKKCIW